MTFWHQGIAKGKAGAADFSARIATSFDAEEAGVYRSGPTESDIPGPSQTADSSWTALATGKKAGHFLEGNDEITADVTQSAGQVVSVTLEYLTCKIYNHDFQAIRFGVSKVSGDAAIAAAVAIAA